jgi:hypothetical protein
VYLASRARRPPFLWLLRAFRLGISSIRVHSGRMNSFPPGDELATLRDLLNRIEAGELTLRHGDRDVSKQELSILKREIARLEKVLDRDNSQGDKPITYAGRTKRFSRNDD